MDADRRDKISGSETKDLLLTTKQAAGASTCVSVLLVLKSLEGTLINIRSVGDICSNGENVSGGMKVR